MADNIADFGKVQEQAKTLELNNATTELNKATVQKAEEIKVLRGNDSPEESAEKTLPLSLQSIILAGRNKSGYEISKAKDKAIFENDIATKQAEEELILKNQQANENLTNKYLEEEEEFWYKIADAKNSEDHSRIMNDNLKLKRDYIRARSETSPTNLRHALELNSLQGQHRAEAIIAKSNYLSKTISDEYDNLAKSYRDNVDLYIKNLGPTHQWLSDELESIYAKSMQLSANEMADATATAGPLDGIIRSFVDLADSSINLAATVGSPIYTPDKGFFNLPSSPDVKPVEGLLRYLFDYKSVNPHSLISDDYSTFDKLSITYLLHALAESAAEMGLVMFQGAKFLGAYNQAIRTERGVATGVLSGEVTETSLIEKVSQKIRKNLDKNITAYKAAGKNDIAERIAEYKRLLIDSETNAIKVGILNAAVDKRTASAIMGTIAGTYSRPGLKSFIKEAKMPIALAGIDILRRVSDLAAERDGGQIYAKDFLAAFMHWGVDMAGGVAMVAPAIKTLPKLEAKQSLKELLSPSAFKKVDFLDKVADIGVGAVTEGYGEMIQTYLELQAANDYRLPSLSTILNSTLPSMRQYRDILTEAGTLGAALGGGITATVEIGSSVVNKFKNKNKDDDGNGGNPPPSSSSSDDSSITGGINPTRDDAGETLDSVKNDQASKDSYTEKQKRVNDLKQALDQKALDQTTPSDVDKKQRTEESKKAEAEQQALARLEKRAQKENEVKEKEAKIKNVDKKDVNKINGKNKSYSVRRDEISKAARQLKADKNKLEKKLENTKSDDEAIDIADKIADIDERLDLVSEVIDGLNELETGAKVDAILSELSNVLTTSVTQEAGSNTVNKAGLLDAITRLENAKTQDEFSEAMKDIVDNSNITSDQLQKAIEYQRNAGVADSKTTQQTLTGNKNKGKQDTESNKEIESKQDGGSSGINDSNISNNQTSTDIDNTQQSDSTATSGDNAENNATQDNTTNTSSESTATTETTSGTDEVQKTLNARDIKDLETRRNLLKSLPPELIARAMVEGSGRPSFSNTNRSSLPTNNRSKLWQEFVEKYLIVPISKDLLNDGSSPVQSKQKVNETILGDNDVEIFVIENQYIDENGEIAYYNAKNGITSKISTLLTNIARLHNQEISNIISNITKEMEKENANPETIASNIETLKQKYMEELQSVHDNLSLLEYLAHVTRGTPLQHKISQISYSLMRRLDKQRTELQNIAKELKTRLGIDIESSFDIDVSSPVKEQDNSKYDGLFTALSKTTTSIFKSVRRAIDTYYKIKNQGDQKEAKNARSKIINVIHRIGKALKALVDIRANDDYATMYNTVVESLHRIGIEMYIQNRIDGFKYNIFGTEFTLNPKMEFIHKYFQDLFLDFLNRSYGTDIKTTILDAMLNDNANIQHLALFKDFLNDIEISETLIQEIFPSFKSGVVGSSNVEQRKYSLFDILAPSDPATVKALLKEEEIQQALGKDQHDKDIPINDENIMANIDKIRDTIRNRIFSSNAGKDIKLRLRASILSNQTAIEKMDNLLDIGLFIHLNAVSAQSVVAGEGNQTVREQKLLALQTQFVKNMLDSDKKYTEYEINQFISAANVLAATYLQSKTYNGKPIETVVGDENHPTDLVVDPDFLADYSLHFKYRADAAMNLLKEKTEITNDITDLKMLIAASPMPNSVRLQNLMALQETAISFDETSLAALKEIGIDEDTLLNAMKDPNNVLNDPIEYNKKKEEWIEHADTVEARVRMLKNGRDFFGNYYRIGFNTVQDGQIMTTFKYVYIPDLAIKCNEKGDALILPKNKKWLLNYGIDINDAASTKEFLDQILIQTDEVVSQDTGDINTSSAILDKIENRNAELGQLMFGLANMKKRNEISAKARVSGRDTATELAEAINNETDENVKSVLLSKVDYSKSFYFGYRIEPNGRMGTPYAQSPVSSKLLRGVTAKRPPNKYYSYEDIKAIRDIVNSNDSEAVKREKVKAIKPTGNSLCSSSKWGYRYEPKPKRDENGNILRNKKGKIIYETSKNGKIIYERVRNTQPKSKEQFAKDKRYGSARQGQLLGLARVFGLDIEKFTETADGRFIYEIKGIDRAVLSNIDTQKIRFVVSHSENGKVDINLTALYNALISDNPVDSAEAAVMLNDIISYFKQKKFDSWSIADDHFGEVIRNLTEFEKGFEKDSNGNIIGFDARNVNVSRLAIYGDGSATLHMQNSVRFRNIEMALALTGVYASVDGKFVSNAEKYAEYKRVKQAIQRRVEELTSDENELLTPAAKANIRAIMEKKGIDAHTFPLITAIMSAIPLSGVSLVSKLVAETNIADRDFSKSIFTPSAYGAGEKSFFEKEKESSGEVLKIALVNTAREFFGKSENIKDIYDLLNPKFSGNKEQLKKNITARFLAHIKNKTEGQNSKEARALSSFVDFYNQSEAKKAEAVSMLFGEKNLNKIFKNFDNNSLSENKNHINVIALQKSIQTMLDNDIATSDKYAKHFGIPTINNGSTVVAMSQDAFNAALKVAEALNDKDASKKKFIFFKLQEFKDEFDELLRQIQADKDAPTKQFRTKHFTLKFGENKEIQIEVNPENSIRSNFTSQSLGIEDKDVTDASSIITNTFVYYLETNGSFLPDHRPLSLQSNPLLTIPRQSAEWVNEVTPMIQTLAIQRALNIADDILIDYIRGNNEDGGIDKDGKKIGKVYNELYTDEKPDREKIKKRLASDTVLNQKISKRIAEELEQFNKQAGRLAWGERGEYVSPLSAKPDSDQRSAGFAQIQSMAERHISQSVFPLQTKIGVTLQDSVVQLLANVSYLSPNVSGLFNQPFEGFTLGSNMGGMNNQIFDGFEFNGATIVDGLRGWSSFGSGYTDFFDSPSVLWRFIKGIKQIGTTKDGQKVNITNSSNLDNIGQQEFESMSKDDKYKYLLALESLIKQYVMLSNTKRQKVNNIPYGNLESKLSENVKQPKTEEDIEIKEIEANLKQVIEEYIKCINLAKKESDFNTYITSLSQHFSYTNTGERIDPLYKHVLDKDNNVLSPTSSNINKVVNRISNQYKDVVYDKATNISNEMVGENGLITTANETVKGFFHKIRGIVSCFGQTINSKVFKKKDTDMSIYNKEGTKIEELSNNDNIVTKKYKIGDNLDNFLDTLQETAGLDKNIIERIKHDFNTNSKSDVSISDIVNAYQDLLLEKKILEKYSSSNESKFPSFQTIRSTTNNTIQSVTVEDSHGKHTIDGIDISDIINNEINLYEKAIAYFYNQGWITSEINSLTETMLNNATLGNDTVFVMATNNMQDVNAITSFKLSNNQMSEAIYFKNDNKPENSNKDDKDLNSIIQDLIVKHYNNNGNGGGNGGGGGKRNLRSSINSRISNYKNNRSRFQLPNVDAPNVVEYTINQGQSPTTSATSTTTNDNQAEVSLDDFVNNRIIARLTQMKREYPHIAPLINMIEKLVLDLKNNIEKNMKIYYSQIPDEAKGAFRVDSQGNISITIYSNSNLFTELHEFIHAATTFALRYDSNESNILVSNIKRINRLMYNSINKLNPSDRSSLMARLGLDDARFDYIFGINGELSLEALSEFIATALSEPKIMEYLNGLEVQVEYQRQDPTKGTKLGRFFKAMPILIKYVTQLVLHKLNQEPLSALEFLSQNVAELSQYNTKESAQKLIEARDNRPIEKINKALVKAASLLTRTTVERYAQGRDISGMVEELEKHYQSKMAMKLLEKSAYKIMKYPKGARHVATAVWLMASFLYSKKNYFSKNPYRREVLQEAIADLRQRLIEHTIFDTKIGLDLGITASRWLKDQVNIINRATSMRTAVDFEIEQSRHEMKQTIKAFLRQTEAMEKFLSDKKTEDEYVENVFKLILHNNIGDYFWGRDIVANEVEDLTDFILNPSDSNIHKMREMSKEKQAKAFELLGIKDNKDISNSISQTVQDLAYTRITDINPGKLNISNIEMALKYAGLLKSGVELTSSQKEAVRLLHQSITLEAIAMPHRDTQGLDANLTYYKERTKLVRDIMINDNPNIDYSELHEGVTEGMKSMIRLHKRCVDAQYTARMLDMNSNKRFMEKPGDLFLIDNKDMYKNIYTFSRDTADAHYLDSYKPYQYNSDLDLKVLDPNQSIEDPSFNYDKEKAKLETLGYELLYTNDKGVETWGYNGPAKYSPSRMTRGYMFDTNDHKGRVEYLLDEVEYDAMKDIEREEFWEGAKDRFVDIGKQYSDNYMPSSKDLEYNRYSSLGGSETIMKVSGLSNQAFEAITNSSRSVYDGFASLEEIAQKNNIRGFINNQLFYQIIESHKDIMKRKPNLAENGTTRPHHSEVLFRRNGDKLEFNKELQDKYGFTLTRRDIKEFQRLWNFLDLDSEVNTNDGNIYIDSRFIDVVFGHKKLDLGRSFEDTHPGLFKLSKLIQTGIQSLGREMKNNIIMRNPKLVAINAMGNFWGVVGEGVPAKQAAEAWVHYVNELNDYKRQITEKKLLETQINNYKRNIYRTDDNLTAEQKEDRAKQLEQQLAEINRSIEGNAVTPLIRAGMYSNIVEDAETEGFKYFDELAEFAIKTGNLSTERAEAMRELFMTENSNVYKMMGDMTRAGDFIPRVILYYHIKSKGPQPINRIVNGKIVKDIETQDELHGRALDEARDRFINYNTPMWSPTARALEALNIIMFSKYRLAVQYQILQAFKNAPVQATGMVALEMALQASGLKFNPVSSYLAESVAFGGNLPSGLWKGVGDVLSSAWRWKFVTP